MLLTTPQKRIHLNKDMLLLTLNNEKLTVVSSDKILEIHIDNNLTWTDHTNAVAKKIASNLWLLSRIKEYLSTDQRVQFYKAYIQPHIDYCNSVWGGTSQRNLDRIYRLQKRACKIILDYQYESKSIAISMEELKILNIYERIYLKKAKIMYKISFSFTPQYINEMFHLRPLNDTLQSLRSSGTINYVLPKPNKELFKQSLIYSGPMIWNNLPDKLKHLETIDSFLEFATFNNLVLTNTLGPHKPSRRWTWHSPDGKHHNQIDYILVKKRFRSGVNIHRTRSFPGADIGSDHDLVMMTFQVRLKMARKPNQPRLRFDLEKLRNPDVACTFQATIGGKFAPLVGLSDEDMDMDTMITTYNTAVTDAASEILGKERRRKKPWVTKDVLDLCDERRDLKKKRYEAEGAKEYREANRRVQKAVKKAKEDWIGAQCEEIETCLNKNNSKRAYQLVKDLTSEKQGRSSTIQDKSGKCLTEEKEILSRWTEYCSELYNYESCGDNAVLDCSQPPEEDLQPILREEVEIAVASLKRGKSAGVDNIPAELVQAGGETMIDVLTEICNRIWRTGEWPTPWTQSLIITLPKKGNLQLCQNYRTISLISHSSKVMLKVILNRLKPQAEEIIAEEQAGFRAGRSTTEQIFNLRILCEKYLQHQQNLYHVFIDFKKAFDRVWHAALWATMRKYNISASLVRTIEQLYDKATSAVQMNGSIGEWFRTTVGVRQGCLLSPTLFNIFLERIMSDALEEHDGKVSIGGRNITNLRFADDIDALAEEEQELEALVESLDKTCTRYKMEISAEKTKLMTNSATGIQREIRVKGQKLGTVTSFKYLGAVVSDDGSKPEVLSRIAQATAALTKLKPIWRDNNISLGSKVKLMRSLVISIFLYACESWTLTAELEKRTQAFEMRCYRRLLNISYKDHVTNEEVRRKIQAAIGEHDELLTLVKKRKLRWFGHVSRWSSGLAKTILQGTVKGKRKRGRQKKRWEDNIKEWTEMDFASSTRAAENRSRWKGIVANSSVVPRRPSKVMG